MKFIIVSNADFGQHKLVASICYAAQNSEVRQLQALDPCAAKIKKV
jgi:hypothetical protein